MGAASDVEAFFQRRFNGSDPPRPSDVRSAYERDRARVIHSSGFRRLQGKTQVMGVGEGDFHRTRLTHSIECAQIGIGLIDQVERSTVLPSGLKNWLTPTALIETACFAHDLGHPPFGHGGEQALFRETRTVGGFEGNAQTLRLLTKLEKHGAIDQGLNPTRRLVLSVLKYPVRYSSLPFADETKHEWKPPKCYYDDEADIVDWAMEGFSPSDRSHLEALGTSGRPAHRTFDCSVMEMADDIAYGIHDIEDIVARRLAPPDRIEDALITAFAAIGGTLPTADGNVTGNLVFERLLRDSYSRKQMIGRLVNVFMTSAAVAEYSHCIHPLVRYRLGLPEPHSTLLDKLKLMAFKLVIGKAPVQQLEQRGMRVVSNLYLALRKNPQQLIPSWDRGYDGPASVDRRVCDYVAGMTDSYAEKVYRRLFVPGFGSSSDEL